MDIVNQTISGKIYLFILTGSECCENL